MSKWSYATEIPFKKKMFLPRLEVVSPYFRDSWGTFSMCTPEILSYFFWALFTYKHFFFTPGIPPQTRSSTLLYSTVYRASSMPYTIWPLASFKCYFLCFASRRLFQPFWFAHWTFPGDLLRTHFLLSVWSSSSPLIQILPNLQGPDKRYFSQEASLLSWPLEPMMLRSEPLDWQFTDCHHLGHCLILLLMSQGSPTPCPSFLTVRSLSGGVEEFRTVPTVECTFNKCTVMTL